MTIYVVGLDGSRFKIKLMTKFHHAGSRRHTELQ